MKDNQLSNILSQYDAQEQVDGQLYTLNLGPTHPATHGIFQNVLTMDGERILHSEQTVGYIHRAFEKLLNVEISRKLPLFTDRLNYCSAPINNIGCYDSRKTSRDRNAKKSRLYTCYHDGNWLMYCRPLGL